MGPDGLIKIAAANSPRFDHSYNSATGEIESLGLLIEEARTNFCINSENLSLWTGTANMIPTGNAILLPNGNISTEVEYRGETTEANTKLLRPSPSGSAITAGDTWVFSVFLRAGTEQTCYLALLDRFNSGGTGRTFDMVDGVFLGTQGYFGTVTGGQTGVEKYPNGWYKVWISAVFTVDEPQGHQIYLRLNANSNSIPFTTSFSAWGAQLEKASFPTSYIPTAASTVTRTADNASMTGTNFSSWYNPNEGTLFFIGNNNPPSSVITTVGNTNGFVTINDFTSNTRIDFRQRIVSSILSSNGTNVSWATSTVIDITDNSFQRVSMAYSSNNHAQAQNGYLTRTSTNSIEPINASRLAFFVRDSQTTPPMNVGGHISQLTYYPTRLPNNILQNLTR
jgi:hypothetical protein